MPRSFTVAEVNVLVPELTRTWTRILQLRGQLRALYKRLESQRYAPDGDRFEPEVAGAPPEVIRERRTFKALLETLKGEIDSVHRMGCTIKDLDVGLVDWPGKNGSRDVLLCWRFGEPEVAFFHDVDAGFAGRRPVSELEPPAQRLLH